MAPTVRARMTEGHKTALAEGRERGRAVRRYLDALAAEAPKRRGRPAAQESPEELERRIATLTGKIEASGTVLGRLELIQARLDAQNALDALSAVQDSVPLDVLEAEFVKVAAAYSEQKGLTRAAWRAVGVPARVLAEAGVG